MRASGFTAAVVLLLPLVAPHWARAQEQLTLESAVAIALRNNPRLALEQVNAEIADQNIVSTRAGLYPLIAAHTTAAGATTESRLAAGALNNPIIFNRYAAGTSLSQLVTDFGRTSQLVESSRLRARSQREWIEASKAALILAVHRAFFATLRAGGVMQVAVETEKARALAVEQVSALAKSNLRSTLDVSFAEVNLSEAKLASLLARNEHQMAMADLSATLGYSQPRQFALADVALPDGAPPAAADLIAEAVQGRAETASLRLEREAALRVVAAERKASLPTVTALANLGVAPVHDDRLKNRYAAGAINLSVPVFNGHLFTARRREAELRVAALDHRLRELENLIARDVTTAALAAQTAHERIALTEALRKQAALAAELAQERYNIGLSSIVELSQAQLNQAGAEMRSAAARYDYLQQRSVLDFQTGRLR
ncbi:MAG: TolC family protein [Bryobacterales bacterium]|nr:TolC family protein [Bryobacterales bacterium]